jgi:hypothetical protein
METYGELENVAPQFFTSAPHGDEGSASQPGCCTPGETALGAHWIGGWVGSAENRTPAVQPLARRYTGS